MTERLLPAFVALITVANVVAFVQMGRDKRRAQAGRGARRLSERTLLAPTLLCGDAGLLAGMFVYRHKTRKRSFHLAYAASVAARLGLLWLVVWAPRT